MVLGALVLYDIYGLGRMVGSGAAVASRMDHAAHLAGLATGYLYFEFGREHVWKNRIDFLKWIGYK
jgi:membrane associated rhomboid family serine protease